MYGIWKQGNEGGRGGGKTVPWCPAARGSLLVTVCRRNDCAPELPIIKAHRALRALQHMFQHIGSFSKVAYMERSGFFYALPPTPNEIFHRASKWKHCVLCRKGGHANVPRRMGEGRKPPNPKRAVFFSNFFQNESAFGLLMLDFSFKFHHG